MDTLAEISRHFAAKWLDSGFRNQVDSIAETSSLSIVTLIDPFILINGKFYFLDVDNAITISSLRVT